MVDQQEFFEVCLFLFKNILKPCRVTIYASDNMASIFLNSSTQVFSSGVVSTANNGGFTSIRTKVSNNS